MPSKGNPETHNDSARTSINAETPTKQSDNAASDETSADSNKGKSTKKTLDFSKLFADDSERNKKISIAARIILISIVYILCVEIHVSIIHLEEVQKLIKAPENTPSEILETINNIRNTFSFLSLFLIILIIAFASCFTKMIMDFLDKYPQRVFVVTVSLGGVLAFSIPQYLYSFKFIGETKDITTSLLTVTGGILAVFTLLKTHQKSELEREQLDTQKNKDKRDHTRQIHAERHSRYTAAIEQLASSKSVIRMGGAYSLIDLMNEWLSDKETDSNATHATEKNIFENLCAYIRSPFLLAIGGESTFYISEIYQDEYTSEENKIHLINNKHALADEVNIRESILSALSNFIKKTTQETYSNLISPNDLPFNFFNTIFFYNFYDLTLNKAKFSNSNFYGPTYFSNVIFKGGAAFSNVTFHSQVYFGNCIFEGDSFFGDTYFQNPDCFTSVRFKGEVDFTGASFLFPPHFNSAHFAYNEKFDFENYGFDTCWIIADGEESVIGIDTYEVSLELKNGKVVTASLPKGARLFDPESWNEKYQKYDNESRPATPPPPSKNINHLTAPTPSPKNTQIIPMKFSSSTNNI